MAQKKKPQNKSEKAVIENKVEKPTSIDWSSLPAEVWIIGLKGKHLAEGQEYKTPKDTAKILVEKGDAKLK